MKAVRVHEEQPIDQEGYPLHDDCPSRLIFMLSHCFRGLLAMPCNPELVVMMVNNPYEPLPPRLMIPHMMVPSRRQPDAPNPP